MQYMRERPAGDEEEYGYEDEEDPNGQYIDLNSLPEDQRQYFL
jgi:hypothetical protein